MNTTRKTEKIWIDDVRPAPDGYSWVKTVNDAIQLLDDDIFHNIVLIDIDHDAGDYYNDGGDYIRVLDYLEFIGRNDIAIHIHSMNPVGINNMKRIIRRNHWLEV